MVESFILFWEGLQKYNAITRKEMNGFVLEA